MNNALRLAAALTSVLAIQPALTPARAGGFALEQQNARALGAAFAGAQARKADAGFAVYNPAAIAGVDGLDISVNTTFVTSVTSYENAQGVLLGFQPITGVSDDDGFDRSALIPNLSLAAPIGDRIALGLVVNAPFGLKTVFDSDSVIRYQAQESQAMTVAVSPTLAIQLTDNFSVAGGLRIQYIDLSVTAVIDAGGIAAASAIPGFAPGSSDLPASFDGDDVAIGFTAGFLAELTPRLTLGGSYASKISHDVEGDAAFDIAASAAGATLNVVAGLFAPTTFASEFRTPAIAGLGLQYAASERLTLLASTTWSRWSAFDEVALLFANPAQPPEILTQNWEDSWTFSVGGEYAASEATSLRAGFMFDDTPVADAYASPRIPDSNRYWATAGASQRFSERLSGDLGLAVAFFENRPIDLPGVAPADFFRGALSADLKTTAFAVSGRLRYSF